MTTTSKRKPEVIKTKGEIPEIGTFVTVGWDSRPWEVLAFEQGLAYRPKDHMRVTALTVNGEERWNWKPIVELKPITVRILQPNIPEWRKQA